MLKTVARDYILDFANDPMRKYWTLYDISSSIVAAFVQYLANNPNSVLSKQGHEIATLASSIANYAIKGISSTFEGSKMSEDGNERILLLADIVGILYPILAFKGEAIDDGWRDVYKRVLVYSALFR